MKTLNWMAWGPCPVFPVPRSHSAAWPSRFYTVRYQKAGRESMTIFFIVSANITTSINRSVKSTSATPVVRAKTFFKFASRQCRNVHPHHKISWTGYGNPSVAETMITMMTRSVRMPDSSFTWPCFPNWSYWSSPWHPVLKFCYPSFLASVENSRWHRGCKTLVLVLFSNWRNSVSDTGTQSTRTVCIRCTKCFFYPTLRYFEVMLSVLTYPWLQSLFSLS